MRTCIFLITLTCYLMRIKSDFNPEIVSGVIASVQRYFNSGCIFLLHIPGFKNLHILNEIRRRVDACGIEISILTFNMMARSPQINHCRYVPPLSVLMFNDNATLHYLRMLPNSNFKTMKWIMFLDSDRLQHFFLNTHIPFDSEFLITQQEEDRCVVLKEVYHINSNLPLQRSRFGNWTLQHGLLSPKTSLYYRRSNLNGTTIKIGYFNDEATAIIQRDDGLPPLVEGYFAEVWRTLEDKINFKSKYNHNEERAFGVIGDDGEWTGLMGMILRKEADVAVQTMTITSERSEFVDFTMPLLRSSNCIVIRKPDRKIFKRNNFLRPFSEELWIGVIMCMAVLTICLSSTYYLKRLFSGEEDVFDFGIIQSFNYVYTSFCQQDCAINPSAVSSRIICIVIKLTATVLVAGYSACLIANLAVHRTVLPFTDLESLLNDGTYNLGLLANSHTVMFYKNTNDTIRQRIYGKLIAPYTLPNSEYQAMQWICAKNKYAFLGVFDTFFNQKSKFDCRIITAWKSDWRNDLALSIAKGNPYRGIIENTLHRMRITGVLHRLKSKSWTTAHQEHKKLWESVPLEAVGTIMLIPFLAAILSLCILLCEIFIHRKFHKQSCKIK